MYRYVKIIENVLRGLVKIILSNKILFGIIFLAFILRFMGLYPNFINHPDEGWVQTYSAKLFQNIITRGDLDPHTYKYGSFIFYLAALPYFPIIFVSYFFQSLVSTLTPSLGHFPNLFQYIQDLSSTENIAIFWSQRALVALVGGFSVWILYLITKKLFNKYIAIISSFIFAIAPLHVRDSHYLTTDVPVTFFILLSVLFMINLFQNGKLKWYILSGIMIGVSSTVRYFPVALLIYPIAVIYDRRKDLKWIFKILAGGLAVFFGIFLGVPFLFLHPESRIIFQEDLQKWVWPWYTTTISIFLTSIMSYISSHGKNHIESLSTLIPNNFYPYYASFLFFKGFGQILSIFSMFGILISLFKFPKKLIFLIIVPLFTFIYISSYLHAQYERLAVPIVPFMSIFAAIFIYYLWNLKNKNLILKISVIVLIFIGIYQPLVSSLTSSWACGGKTVYQQSQEWIDQNMPDNPKVAYKTYIAFPSKYFDKLIEIKPTENFSLEEVRNTGSDYAFINKSNTLGYYAYRFDTDFFIAPKDIYQNNFVLLSLYEYKTRATLLKEISQPSMCAQDDLVFYKLPKESRASNLIKKFNLETQKNLDEWKILQYSIKSNIVLNLSNGSLVYKWQTVNYTAPRIVSKKIPVSGGKTYTFSALIRSDQILNQNERDGFLRIDFYSDEKADISLPGDEVALSPRTYGKPQFRKTSVSSISPKNSRFAVLSLQINATKPSGEFFFKDLEFFGQ